MRKHAWVVNVLNNCMSEMSLFSNILTGYHSSSEFWKHWSYCLLASRNAIKYNIIQIPILWLFFFSLKGFGIFCLFSGFGCGLSFPPWYEVLHRHFKSRNSCPSVLGNFLTFFVQPFFKVLNICQALFKTTMSKKGKIPALKKFTFYEEEKDAMQMIIYWVINVTKNSWAKTKEKWLD